MSDVFYSQVNSTLKKELTARSMAGKLNRTTTGIDFMLNKIANVVVSAYDNIEDDKPITSIGGGISTTNKYGGSYLAGGTDGYLANDSTRIGPVLTGVQINIADQAQFAINSATINITIPDPSTLDLIEESFLKPGRTVQIKIQHPDSAILSGTTLLAQDEMLFTTRILKQQYGDNPEDIEQFLEMNKMIFNGFVNGYKSDYQTDGTITFTLTVTATASIYADVSMFVSNPEIPNAKIDQKITSTFSGRIKDSINLIVESQKKDNSNGFIKTHQVLDNTPVKQDRTILYGPLYTNPDGTKYQYKTFISIGLLIDYIEKILYEPVSKPKEISTNIPGNPGAGGMGGIGDPYDPYGVNDIVEEYSDIASNSGTSERTSVPNMRIICNDQISKTRFFKELVSADPQRIFLYQGNEAEFKTNSYGFETITVATGDGINQIDTPTGKLIIADNKDAIGNLEYTAVKSYEVNYFDGIKNAENVPGFYETTTIEGEPVKHGCLSRILIELNVIEELESALKDDTKTPFTIKNFMIAISTEIKKQTGLTIFPGLIFHPELPSTLIYYDTKYIGPDKNVAEYEIPVFSSADQGTIVREMKLGYDLPAEFKNALLGFQSVNISPTATSAFNPYLNSSGTARKQHIKEWKIKHKEAIDILSEAKQDLTNDYQDSAKIKKLQDALQNYDKYSLPDLEESLTAQKPRWVYNLEFTIDGINGFRYGDVLHFRGIPKKYRDDYVFNIVKIVHNVDATGQWTTAISCISRPRSKSII